MSDADAPRATAWPLLTDPVSAIIVDVGVLGQPRADLGPVAGDHVEHAGRQQIARQLGELQGRQGVCSDGLMTSVFPAARIGAIFQAAISSG